MSSETRRDQTVSVRLSPAEIEAWGAAARQRNTTVSDAVRDVMNASVASVEAAALDSTRAATYVQDPCPYRFNGLNDGGPSLVRDFWAVRTSSDVEASERLRRFEKWQGDAARAARSSVSMNVDGGVSFALHTGNTGAVIPPGYSNLFLMPEDDRPLRDMATRAPLPAENGATPFTLPGVVTATGAVDPNHTEGVNPPQGSLTVPGETVIPVGIPGLFQVTREVLDSSNPAIDLLALGAMRRAWRDRAEELVYAEVNGPNGQGGTITGGFVPSGAAVRTATPATTPAELKKALAVFAHHAGTRARSVAVSRQAAEALSELDPSNVWLRGVDLRAAPKIPDGAAGDGDVFITGREDLWVWESPLLTFRFPQRGGPALEDLALWGYFAVRLLRPVGLSAIRVS